MNTDGTDRRDLSFYSHSHYRDSASIWGQSWVSMSGFGLDLRVNRSNDDGSRAELSTWWFLSVAQRPTGCLIGKCETETK